MHPLENLTQVSSTQELKEALRRLGAETLTYREGQVLQYQHQLPRGTFLLVEGRLKLLQEDTPTSIERHTAVAGPYLVPPCDALDFPLPWSIQAESDCTVWFFSRYLCQRGETLRHCLSQLQRTDSPLYQLWSSYVINA
jgi:CRP-like cAMP-binding protein